MHFHFKRSIHKWFLPYDTIRMETLAAGKFGKLTAKNIFGERKFGKFCPFSDQKL